MSIMTRRSFLTLLAPLRDRRARPLLASFWSAELADGVVSVVVPVAVYAVTQEVSALALVFLGRLSIGIAMASLGGVLADRYQRKLLLLGNYLARLVCALAFLAWQEHVLFFAVVGTVLGSLGAFDNPAAEAAVRSVFRHDLQAVAALRKVGQTLSQMVGPALGGLLLGVAGVNGALWTTIALMVLAAVIIAPAQKLPPAPARIAQTAGTPDQVPRRPRFLTAVFVATFTSSFLVGIVIAAGVPHVESEPAAPEGAYGYALACYGLGAVVGAGIAGSIRWRDRHLPAVLLVSAGAYGLVAAAGMVGPWWSILISWLVWGILFGPEDILTDRYVVSRTPDPNLGRLYARWSNVGRLGAAAAYVAMLAFADADPTTLAVVLALGSVVLAPLLITAALHRARGRVAA